MKTQFGTAKTGDFSENTMTFDIKGEMTLCAGEYAIIPINEYNKIKGNYPKSCTRTDINTKDWDTNGMAKATL